jgi:Resolvase, N terminal domain
VPQLVSTDNDISTFSARRPPGYEALLEAIERGHVKAIVTMDPDRLHRSPKELEQFIDIIEQHDVKIATVQAGELDLATAAGRMTARVVGAVARHESEHKSERLKGATRTGGTGRNSARWHPIVRVLAARSRDRAGGSAARAQRSEAVTAGRVAELDLPLECPRGGGHEGAPVDEPGAATDAALPAVGRTAGPPR